MPPRYGGFALAFALLAGAADAFAQPSNEDRSVLQTPLNGPDFLTVSRVDSDGTIVVAPSATVPAQFRDNLSAFFAEGMYLLVTNDGKPLDQCRVIRVQVTDVAAGSVFTMKTGPQAAAHLRVNDTARLVRTLPTTTARLRALPDEVPVQAPSNDAKNEVEPREAAARTLSTDNLKRIGLAMHNFHTIYNAFPPAVIYGPDGKPWHSWRVLILPYLEHADLYRAYDFSQPWDSPKNKSLIDKMPDVYRDPIHGDTKEPYTHYAALVGPGAVFRAEGAKQTDPQNPPLAGGLSIQKITDGTSNTVMISSVEAGQKIPWTKPEDIDVGLAVKGPGPPRGFAARYTSQGPGGGEAAPFLFCDGSVRRISKTMNASALEALISCAGGEVIEPQSLRSESTPTVSPAKMLKIRLDGGKVTATIE